MTDRDLHLLAQAIHGEALHRAWINYGGSETLHYPPAGIGGSYDIKDDATISQRYDAHTVHQVRMAYTYGPTKGMSVEDQDRLWTALEKLEAVRLATTFKDPVGGGE